MKRETYKIPVVWQVSGIIEIEAAGLTEALLVAEDAPLPKDGEYIEGSFEIDHDGLEFHNSKKLLNK